MMYRYVMHSGLPCGGACPNGWITWESHDGWNYGIISYDHELLLSDVIAYQLHPILTDGNHNIITRPRIESRRLSDGTLQLGYHLCNKPNGEPCAPCWRPLCNLYPTEGGYVSDNWVGWMATITQWKQRIASVYWDKVAS